MAFTTGLIALVNDKIAAGVFRHAKPLFFGHDNAGNYLEGSVKIVMTYLTSTLQDGETN